MKKIRDIDIKTIYIFISLLSLGITFFWLLLSHGNNFSNLFFYDSLDTGMDFFHSIEYTRGKAPYTKFDTIYPPLANMFFFALLCFVPEWQYIQWSDDFYESISYRGTNVDLRVWQPTMLLFMFFIFICIFAFLFASFYYLDFNLKNFIVVCLIFLSYGVLYSLERGNIIIVSLICSMIFVFFYDSDNKIKKEVALISLALAFGLKLYPAILGILLIYDKKIKEAIRTFIYGLIMFFVPFFFFEEKADGIIIFIKHMFFWSSKKNSTTLGLCMSDSITSLIKNFQKILGVSDDWQMNIKLAKAMCLFALFSCLIFGAFFQKKWQKILTVVLGMIFFQNQGTYILIFMIIPLCVLLKEEKNLSKSNLIAFFGILLTTLTLPLHLESKIIFFNYTRFQLCLLILYTFITFLMLDNVKKIIQNRR